MNVQPETLHYTNNDQVKSNIFNSFNPTNFNNSVSNIHNFYTETEPEKNKLEVDTPLSTIQDNVNDTSKSFNTMIFNHVVANKYNCFYTNADSVMNKRLEMDQLLKDNVPDLVLITESCPKRRGDDFSFNMIFENYSTESDLTGRGVTLLVRDHIKYKRRLDLESFKPTIAIDLLDGNSNVLLLLTYRSPNSGSDDNMLLCNMIDSLCKHLKNDDACIIAGDFNFPEINWLKNHCGCLPRHPASQFHKVANDHFLQQLITEPTHFRAQQSANVLDLLFTNNEELISGIRYLPPLGNSHHVVTNFNIHFNQTKSAEHPKPHILKYAMNKGNYPDMKSEFGSIDWKSRLNEELSVEESWHMIESKIIELKDKYIPKRSHVKMDVKLKKPIPRTILDKIRLKRQTFKHYKKFRTSANYKAYCRARNQVTWALRKAEKDTEKSIAKNIKKDPKSFYLYVSNKTKPKVKIADLQKEDGSMTQTDKEKAQVLNDFFTSVFTIEDTTFIPAFDSRTNKKLTEISITEKDITTRLSKLNSSKSEGPDGIHPRILKELSDVLGVPLKILFDKTIKEGRIPTAWKAAEVRPIFKKGVKAHPGNYRPVSLTSTVCKVFEGFLRDALNEHLTENNLLSDHQHGFTSGRSCMTQLLSTVNDWLKFIENGEPVDAIYLDLQKAFDKVPHQRLLTKLKAYGVGGKIWDWVADFLSGRSQHVCVEGERSDNVPVTSGVPQGSVLGPTLFIYFINDMPDIVNCLVKVFADDTKAYAGVGSQDKARELQINLDNLVSWTKDWQINFNKEKCKVVHLGKNNCKFAYKIDGSPLQVETVEKDLGVHVDDRLTFNTHITETVKKANKLVGMISHYISHKSSDVMIPLYKTLIRPILEYGNVVWSPKLRKHIDLIEGVQRRFTKRIIGAGDLSYEERLKKFNLPSLEFRRFRGDMIETYKMTHQLYDNRVVAPLFTLQESVTRGHKFKLVKTSFSSISDNFFTNRIINKWNNLPKAIVLAESLNSFKNIFDKEFSSITYNVNLSSIATS